MIRIVTSVRAMGIWLVVGAVTGCGGLDQSFGGVAIASIDSGSALEYVLPACGEPPNIAIVSFSESPGFAEDMLRTSMTGRGGPEIAVLEVARDDEVVRLTSSDVRLTASAVSRLPEGPAPYLVIGRKSGDRIVESLGVSVRRVPISRSPQRLEYWLGGNPDQQGGNQTMTLRPEDSGALC